MREIDKKILRFLIDGKAYSDGAIMQNFGITEEELKEVYNNLLEDGYLETYEAYEKRTARKKEDMNENHCGSGCGCSTDDGGHKCGKGEDGKGCCTESSLDKSKILVLTDKAISL